MDSLRKDIEKLIFMIHGDLEKEPFITKEYMIEKLQRILDGSMVFHEIIENYFEEKENDY